VPLTEVLAWRDASARRRALRPPADWSVPPMPPASELLGAGLDYEDLATLEARALGDPSASAAAAEAPEWVGWLERNPEPRGAFKELTDEERARPEVLAWCAARDLALRLAPWRLLGVTPPTADELIADWLVEHPCPRPSRIAAEEPVVMLLRAHRDEAEQADWCRDHAQDNLSIKHLSIHCLAMYDDARVLDAFHESVPSEWRSAQENELHRSMRLERVRKQTMRTLALRQGKNIKVIEVNPEGVKVTEEAPDDDAPAPDGGAAGGGGGAAGGVEEESKEAPPPAPAPRTRRSRRLRRPRA